ncbi:MAG: hypothetical protein KGI54_10500 [Pseudomonadota bacterium]|nr:hypothetical protein [Pseudomonadota bacterium]
MSKVSVSFSGDNVVFVDDKNKADTVALLDVMPALEAVRAIDKEQKASVSASQGAISLLNEMLKSPRFDGYKGTCPVNEHVSKELKAAIREIETEYLKPIFSAPLLEKGNKPATIEKAWQEYALGLRTGSYAQAKSVVTKYFAICGALPETDNGKLLPVRAIMRMLDNVEKPQTNNEGIAGKLVKLSGDIEGRTEKTELGDYATAIAALKNMLATYEGLYNESLVKLTDTIGNTDLSAVSDAAISAANISAREAFLQSEYEAGRMDDTAFVIAMADIGIDVEIEDAVY